MSFIGGDYGGPYKPNNSYIAKYNKPSTPPPNYAKTAGWHGYPIPYTPKGSGNTDTGNSSGDNSKKRKNPVKVATSNLFISQQPAIAVEEITQKLFEDLGGIELITISRHDSLNGQDIVYQPIQNITQLSFDYSPQNILASAKTDSDLIGDFLIDIGKYIPGEPSNPNLVYLDDATNDIIIETINVREDERIEVEFLTYTTVEDDTIYIT